MNTEHFVSRLDLASQIAASPWARKHTRIVLGAWGLALERIDTVELCVSELVSNAVRASGETMSAPVARISLTPPRGRHLPDELVVEVADSFHRPPVRKANFSPQSESGRGLFIVEALAKEGIFPAAHWRQGRVVRRRADVSARLNRVHSRSCVSGRFGVEDFGHGALGEVAAVEDEVNAAHRLHRRRAFRTCFPPGTARNLRD